MQQKIKQHNAFTLAEVLITLTIIGVVAAMTLPTLVQSYLEKQRVTQLKTTVSRINQAVQQIEQEYGTIDTWGLTETFQGVDEEGKNILDYSSGAIFMTRLAKYFKGATFLNNKDIVAYVKTLDGRTAFYPWKVNSEDKRYLKLIDGTIIIIGWVSCSAGIKSKCSDFWIVYPRKKDSQLGVDVFNFLLYPQKGLLPNGWNARVGKLAPKCSKFSSNINASSADRTCTAWVYYNENMDYLHCDDLNWQTKTKCK